MQYLGGKVRLAKHLISVISEYRGSNQYWVEPFVGGANVIDKVEGNRIGNDSNEYLIEMLKDTQRGREFPRHITEVDYNTIKQNKDVDKSLTAFVGFGCSFGGKWFGGYAKNKRGDNFANATANALEKTGRNLKDVLLTCSSYKDMILPPNSLIYCDPPYANTTKYKDDFNHEEFWDWCRLKNSEGHIVFVSEYEAPSDFECVWEFEHKTNLNCNKQDDNKRVDRLFKL